MSKSVCSEKLTNRETIQGSTTLALIVTISPPLITSHLDERTKQAILIYLRLLKKCLCVTVTALKRINRLKKNFAHRFFAKSWY